MSHSRIRFDEMREGNPARETPAFADKKEGRLYETPGYTRALRLVWPNGERRVFHYPALDNIICNQDQTSITMIFNRDTVILKGRFLLPLLEEISQQLVREIVAVEERYLDLEESNEPVVTDISVMPN